MRVAIVGYGGSGRGIHARLVRDAGASVSDVVVRDPGRRADAAEDWPGVRLHESLGDLLAAEPPDVIVLASPSQVHAEQAIAVAAAGVPFVVDKPLAATAEDAQAVLEAARAASTPFTVFQNRRWDPEQLTLRAVLERGELGVVHTFERHYERFRPVPKNRWKELDPVGGGLLLDLQPHLVDSAIQLFGPVTWVWAQLRNHTVPTPDDTFLVLQHADGVVSRLWAGSLVGAPGPRTRVLGSRAAYLVTTYETDTEASPFEVLDAAAPPGSEGWLVRGREKEAVPRAPGGHADFYRAVDAWLAGEGPVPVDPADVVSVAQVLDAARVSAVSGARVELPNV